MADVRAPAIEVRVRDLRLAARIGAHAHEMDRRQMLRVAISLTLARAPDDRLDDTIDYDWVVALAEALANEHITLIECFCTRLASACLAAGPVVRAEVVVEKPGALVNGVASARAMQYVDDADYGALAAKPRTSALRPESNPASKSNSCESDR